MQTPNMRSKQDFNDSDALPTLPNVGRRELLAAFGMTLGSGCIEDARLLVSRDTAAQVAFSIKTLPADADPRAIRIARFLAKRLNEVGIAAQVVPMERSELLRDILLDRTFDCYVACFPGLDEPDELRTLLHSRFSTGTGWQNPFGYANLTTDKQLLTQRQQSGVQRTKTLKRLQHSIARNQPFTVVAFPDEIRATRTDRFDGWAQIQQPHSALGYLSVKMTDEESTLRMTTQDARPTENLNPLTANFTSDERIIDLLYDPLGRWIDGKVCTWLAHSWEWQSLAESSEKGPVATVRLRDDLRWHDGEALTATDVAFTYRFLNDTALGTLESPVPSPRFRGAATLVESATAIDEQTVRIRFTPTSQAVAMRAFTTPILPKHIWEQRRKRAETVFDGDTTATKALAWDNRQAVGSGSLQFSNAEPKKQLTLERFDQHFLRRIDTTDETIDISSYLPSHLQHLQQYAGGPQFERLRFIVVPSGAAATQIVLNDEADATATGVSTTDVRTIGRADNVQLHVDQSPAMYHVGFNARKTPFSNVRFRRAVAQLLDKDYIVDEVFDGYAEPAASPLARHESIAEDLRWVNADPVLPFPGANGILNRAKAKATFKNAGFRYTSDGKLLRE
ncbi:peptide/nickel transport system substrate-binding protein [Haladaptatus litoreus]|uniref:Peptide/nickel transport system substrate-binding protein n=1 Tax=Haladaptatus litoreus TaxID=553468 RepID=A0A1N7DMD5_9EURY|nr:ABC transporter substrate-binding protein [Haladaptatus litoreus]SIR76994.1 peptide/nickel transport system substrate-binding protein [Haladaptatus litoreus]